ncbi:unnamed protein product [Heligmosomoides polygyrus]|uniref:EGF-like domain-containing protein n=1 Tax=Heligmosomoides polygyrus TaxID=6339 RepID=A0A183FPK9_HELPZ|nr:unnamed protein product [Heligmosomoides polygyrus]
MSLRRVECVFGHTMTCGGLPMNRSALYPSQTSLVPIHRPQRDGRLAWPVLEIRHQEPGIGCRRQPAPPLTSHHAKDTKLYYQTIRNCVHGHKLVRKFFRAVCVCLIRFLTSSIGLQHLRSSFFFQGTISDDICALTKQCKRGTCHNTFNDFECHCPKGYFGRRCERKDHCSAAPCATEGECENVGDGYMCKIYSFKE